MKNFVVVMFLGLLLLVPQFGGDIPVPEGVRAAIRSVTLRFKVALLYAREPDTELTVPVDGVRVEQIRDTWGAPRSGGRQHEGQDIFAPRGTAVRAATGGYVVHVGENSLGGNVVLVIGAGGRSYYYAHLDSYAPDLKVGEKVKPGTVLGFVGTSGNAQGTPPHLHFGVYTIGGATNPLPLLKNQESASPGTAPDKSSARTNSADSKEKRR